MNSLAQSCREPSVKLQIIKKIYHLQLQVLRINSTELTCSWRVTLSYRNQSIDLLCSVKICSAVLKFALDAMLIFLKFFTKKQSTEVTTNLFTVCTKDPYRFMKLIKESDCICFLIYMTLQRRFLEPLQTLWRAL